VLIEGRGDWLPPGDGYTRGEVVYLSSLSRREAIDEDASQPDSLARTSPDGPGAPTAHEDWDPVFAVARWHDVQAARRRVVERKMAAAGADPRAIRLELVILELRVRGWTERAIAEHTGLQALAVRRRFTAGIADILDELGGELAAETVTSSPSACMHCGVRPRVRIERKRRIVLPGGGRTTVREQRLSTLCIEHHDPGLLTRSERFVTLGGAPITPQDHVQEAAE
jgi:hypothetical protein